MHIETGDYQVFKRQPIHQADIKLIQDECFTINDELRLLIALISDSGMRLAEAAGLMINDVVLNDEVPHLIIKPLVHNIGGSKLSQVRGRYRY